MIRKAKEKILWLSATEQKLQAWLKENIEATNDDVFVSNKRAYNLYLQSAIESGSSAVDWSSFSKLIFECFPDGSIVQADSKFSKQLSRKKPAPKKVKEPKFQKPFPNFNNVTQVLKDMGNREKGYRISTILKKIIDLQPEFSYLKSTRLLYLINGMVNSNRLLIVNGCGLCGFYRLPATPEKKDNENKNQENTNASENKIVSDNENKEKSKSEEAKEDKTENDETKNYKNQETENNDENLTNTDEDKNQNLAEEESKKNKNKFTKKRPSQTKDERSKRSRAKNKPTVRRSNSSKDASINQKLLREMPLALTFQTEPKQASIKKISRYIDRYYSGTKSSPENVKQCLSSGVEKGWFASVNSQTYQLTVDEYNPSHDNNLSGKIMNALVASTEPKSCSVKKLLGYFTDYYDEFSSLTLQSGIFRRAIETACKKEIIKRTSGIAMTGSFELMKPFTPSPNLLATGNVEEKDDFEAPNESRVEEVNNDERFAASFRDKYVPRATKSGRLCLSSPTPTKSSLTHKKEKNPMDDVDPKFAATFLDAYKPRSKRKFSTSVIRPKYSSINTPKRSKVLQETKVVPKNLKKLTLTLKRFDKTSDTTNSKVTAEKQIPKEKSTEKPILPNNSPNKRTSRSKTKSKNMKNSHSASKPSKSATPPKKRPIRVDSFSSSDDEEFSDFLNKNGNIHQI